MALLTDAADDLAHKPLEAGCSAKLQLDDLLRRFPMEWEGQRSSWATTLQVGNVYHGPHFAACRGDNA